MTTKINIHNFQCCYGELCNLYNCPVLYRVNAHAHRGVLDFYGDGIKSGEWRPIVRALSMDQSLRFIAIRCKNNALRPRTHRSESAQLQKSSSEQIVVKDILTFPRSLLRCLSVALRDCLWYNNNLSGLELDGLCLDMDHLKLLCDGIQTSSSLRYLSLRRCFIGDMGCQIICNVLRTHATISSVDFSACSLTESGALVVARLLETLNRYGENWKQSLRYRVPNAEAMPGLRRITLDHNDIGDLGAEHIVAVLQDDRWVKAIDMQNCRLSEKSGENILKMLEVNDTLNLLDVRNNKEIPPDIVADINTLLTKRERQFDWLPDDPACLPRSYSHLAENRFGATESRTTLGRSISAATFIKKATPKPSRTFILKADSKQVLRNRLMEKQSGSSLNRRRCGPNLRNRVVKSETEVEYLQRYIEELSCQLEEEVAKREAAEATRDKAQSRLGAHLRELADTQAAITGRVLVDKGIIQEMNNAFSDLNNFLAMLRKAGMCQLMKTGQNPQKSASWNTSYTSGIKYYDDDPTSSLTSTDVSYGTEPNANTPEKQYKIEETAQLHISSKVPVIQELSGTDVKVKSDDSTRNEPTSSAKKSDTKSSSPSGTEDSPPQETISTITRSQCRKSHENGLRYSTNEKSHVRETFSTDSQITRRKIFENSMKTDIVCETLHKNSKYENNCSDESDQSWTTITSLTSERAENPMTCT